MMGQFCLKADSDNHDNRSSTSVKATTESKAMVVTTTQAKSAATETCQKELKEVHAKIATVTTREDKFELLKQLKETLHTETKHFLDITGQREREHADFMRHILKFVDELNGLESNQNHDWSKDEFFFFAAASFFDGKCQTPEAKALKDDELKRHHQLEPHHPEFEKYNDKECSDCDVVEMAVDRLSRNVQFGDGTVNMEQMKQFLPTFYLGDMTKKQELFLSMCEKYKDVVEREFVSVYPDVKNWKN